MVAGFDRYFQIAPCFRDEASRADRSPGEFYQLDFEMSYVTQEDVFNTIEPVIAGVFEEFANGRAVTKPPFVRIPYDTSMLKYGSDKPDLRNPIEIADVTEHFAGSGFGLFAKIAASGGIVRAIPAPGTAANPRSFFDKLNEWARGEGAGRPRLHQVRRRRPEGPDRPQPGSPTAPKPSAWPAALKPGDAVFFAAGKKDEAPKFSGIVRTKLGDELGLIAAGRIPLLLDHRFPDVRAERGNQADRLQPQPVQHAAGRDGGAGDPGPADHQGLPVRHRLQRHRAVLAAPSATTARTS